MRNLNIAIRSLFKKGRHNVMKIISLSVGLSVALVMHIHAWQVPIMKPIARKNKHIDMVEALKGAE